MAQKPMLRVEVGARTETPYCTSMRCDSSRCVRETGLRKPSQQRTREREMLHVHLRTYTQPTQLFAAEASLQPTPGLLCELA